MKLNPFLPNCSEKINTGGKIVSKSILFADSLITEAENKVESLNSLIDNGLTEQFLQRISVLTPKTFTNLYNDLMAASPYLSDTVLISILFLTDVVNFGRRSLWRFCLLRQTGRYE
ncbi:MAG: hypothetical protein HY738_19205 [Bacteroidia bacterium]|nr:hypothetical protein [Bacteroidia bacterium]